MKKRRKIVLLVTVALVAVVAIVALVYTAPLRTMEPSPTGTVPDTDVLALNNRMNSLFFVACDSGYILIDAGSDAKAVERGLAEIAVDPGSVRHILLTHTDSDHVAALSLFPDAEIHMSGEEAQMVDGTTKRNVFGRNALPSGVLLTDVDLLDDGQTLEFDGRAVSCIAAPGHTPGSMAYVVDDAYLFTGDAFLVADGVIDVHPFTMDSDRARESIVILADAVRSVRRVFTAHYGTFTSESLTTS